jgi:hypothetical protein
MTMEDEAYYRYRARQEEEAARIATCSEARDRHDELASAYRLRSRLILLSAADEPVGERPRSAAQASREPA